MALTRVDFALLRQPVLEFSDQIRSGDAQEKRFTQSQIISRLKEMDDGINVDYICRKRGMAKATYGVWKSQ